MLIIVSHFGNTFARCPRAAREDFRSTWALDILIL
jgi:hypothetical protein